MSLLWQKSNKKTSAALATLVLMFFRNLKIESLKIPACRQAGVIGH